VVVPFLICIWLAASIEGRLWNPVTGAPVRKADVVVGTASGVQVKRVLSDANGHYFVNGLPAGRYRVAAGRAGFVPALAAAVVALRADEARKDLNLTMEVPAAIAGHVADSEGEPVEHITVIALLTGSGKVSLSGSSETNDKGEYRIAGLPAGRFVLRTARAAAPQEGGMEQIYAPAFYPAASEVENAASVTVGFGGEARDIDFHLSKVTGASISGVVRGVQGQQPKVRVARRSTDAVMSVAPESEVTALPDGRFAFPTLAPGRYVVTAQAFGPNEGLLWASQEVALDAGSAACELTLKPARELRAESNEPVRLLLTRVNGMRSQADGKLRFRNVTPGTWELQAAPVAVDQFIESVTWGGQEVLGKLLEIGSGAWPTLRIHVGDRGGTLEGDGGSVSLTPESGGAALEASAEEDGRYRIRGIRPGRYRLACTGEIIEIAAGAVVKRDCKQ